MGNASKTQSASTAKRPMAASIDLLAKEYRVRLSALLNFNFIFYSIVFYLLIEHLVIPG